MTKAVGETTSLVALQSVVLAEGKVRATRNGLVFAGSLTFEEWEQVGHALKDIEGAVQFWVGDWLNYGERHYGEKYAQAVQETTDRASGTLANLAWVAGRIETSRRRENLGFGHHQAVAPLEPAEQDRILAEAEAKGLTMRQVRQLVKSFDSQLARLRLTELPRGGLYELRNEDLMESEEPLRGVPCIITDPPYGEESIPLYGNLAGFASRVLADGGVLAVMSGQAHLPAVLEALQTGGLTYMWTFCCLLPGGTRQIFARHIVNGWKPVIVYARNPEYGTADWTGDVLKSEKPQKQYHKWQQSVSGMAELVGRFSKSGEVVVDPMCGTGTTGVAALQKGRKFLGADIDAAALVTAHQRLKEAADGSYL